LISNFDIFIIKQRPSVMKKMFLGAAVVLAVLILANCNPSKKVAATPPPKINYENNVKAVVMANCTPCHIPANGGNKRPYDNVANLKSDIDEIIHRISLQPNERGFMPFKHARLSDSTINVFKQWKADGLLEN
jgi:hypothetical protein